MISRDTQQQQRALLDNIPDMAWLKDRDCRYLAVNTAYLKILGIPEKAVLGKTPDEIWPPEIAEVYLRTDRRVLKSGRRWRYEETRPDSAGNPRWFETIKSPIRDDAGHIIGTVGISRDISERKAAEDELISLAPNSASYRIICSWSARRSAPAFPANCTTNWAKHSPH